MSQRGVNKPAGKYWHQGFGTINVAGTEVVPFLQQSTAERIAGEAARSLKQKMLVMKVGEFWGYFRAPVT